MPQRFKYNLCTSNDIVFRYTAIVCSLHKYLYIPRTYTSLTFINTIPLALWETVSHTVYSDVYIKFQQM